MRLEVRHDADAASLVLRGQFSPHASAGMTDDLVIVLLIALHAARG